MLERSFSLDSCFSSQKDNATYHAMQNTEVIPVLLQKKKKNINGTFVKDNVRVQISLQGIQNAFQFTVLRPKSWPGCHCLSPFERSS